MRPSPRATAPKAHFHGKRLAARIAKRGREFNGGGHLARQTGLCVNPALGTAHSPQQYLPAVLYHLDRRAAAASGKDTILVPAHGRHRIGQPQAGCDESDHKDKCRDIDHHAVAVIVRVLAALIFCQILDRRRRWDRRAPEGLPSPKANYSRLFVEVRRFSIGHIFSLP